MMKLWNDFKSFAFKGNVLDMAVGVIVGGAFGKIVSSLVADVVTPCISLLTNGQNFSELFFVLSNPQNAPVPNTVAAAQEAGMTTLNYGLFLQNTIDFFLIAASIFLFVRLLTGRRRHKEEQKKLQEETAAAQAAPTTKICPYCCSEIALQAVRCPHCTSVLDAEETTQAAAAE